MNKILEAYCISAKMAIGLNPRDDDSSSLTEPLRLSTIYLGCIQLRNIHACMHTIYLVHASSVVQDVIVLCQTRYSILQPVLAIYPKRRRLCILQIRLPPSIIFLPLEPSWKKPSTEAFLPLGSLQVWKGCFKKQEAWWCERKDVNPIASGYD